MQVNMCVSRITVCQPITLALYMTLCNTVTSGTAPAVGCGCTLSLCALWTVVRYKRRHRSPFCAPTRETGRERRKVESSTRAGVCMPLVITLHRLRLSREVKG